MFNSILLLYPLRHNGVQAGSISGRGACSKIVLIINTFGKDLLVRVGLFVYYAIYA